MLYQLQMEPKLATHPTAYMCGVEQKKREFQLAQKRVRTVDNELKPRQVGLFRNECIANPVYKHCRAMFLMCHVPYSWK